MPSAFGRELEALAAADDKSLFDQLVHQRVLQRILRFRLGGHKPFHNLYKERFGCAYSHQSAKDTLAAFAALLPSVDLNVCPDDQSLECTDLDREVAAAVVELALASHAPLLLCSDAALPTSHCSPWSTFPRGTASAVLPA